jgi:SAM-dependent methyltransferase
MISQQQETDKYYTNLFTKDPSYSTLFPNTEESARLAKILVFLSQIIETKRDNSNSRVIRILDVGCGRGWLANLVNVYGLCDGVDPVEGSIKQARKNFPNLTFYVGTINDVINSPDFQPYDIAIASEVIEHIHEKESFVNELKKCIKPYGHAIVTTPRGEEFEKYQRSRWRDSLQPIEDWISERELCSMFEKHKFIPIQHDRIYIPIPEMSLIHQLLINYKFIRLLEKLRLSLIKKALQYHSGIYQTWCFQLQENA